MNNTINGRTPEEIKRGLECQDCRNCTYDGRNFKDGESRCHEAADDAVALIDKLLECKKQLECERDAAIKDMAQTAVYLCCACKKYHHNDPGKDNHRCEMFEDGEGFERVIACDMFEWRGTQEEV